MRFFRRPKVIVITGATAGLGRATARMFAKRGDSIALLARGRERLVAAANEVEFLGGKALPIPTDVADFSQVDAAAEEVESRLGPIDVWVNNAMTTVFSPFDAITPEEFKRATEVTYLGTVYGTYAALKRMKVRNRGHIVQVGSALAYRAIPLQAPYCGAKHAVRGFTDSLRSELIHDRIRVRLTMVHLPAMNTPQFTWCKNNLPYQPQPIAPIFQPEVGARAIVWASEHKRREVYVGLPSLSAIWANKFAPGLLDRYLARFGYVSQQAHEPASHNRIENLWTPPPGDPGAHGRFNEDARAISLQSWIDQHRLHLALAFMTGTAGGLLLRRKAQNKQRASEQLV